MSIESPTASLTRARLLSLRRPQHVAGPLEFPSAIHRVHRDDSHVEYLLHGLLYLGLVAAAIDDEGVGVVVLG